MNWPTDYIVLQSNLIVFHGQVSSGSAGHRRLAIRQADQIELPRPRHALSTFSLRKIFAIMLVPVDSSITSFLKPRKARHFESRRSVIGVFLSPACLPGKSTKHAEALRESVMLAPVVVFGPKLRPLTIGSCLST